MTRTAPGQTRTAFARGARAGVLLAMAVASMIFPSAARANTVASMNGGQLRIISGDESNYVYVEPEVVRYWQPNGGYSDVPMYQVEDIRQRPDHGSAGPGCAMFDVWDSSFTYRRGYKAPYCPIPSSIYAQLYDGASDKINFRGGTSERYVDVPVTVYGGLGTDRIYGQDSVDYAPMFADGGPGYDKIYATPAGDFLFGGADKDYLRGEDGPDVIYGDGGETEPYGDGGDDRIYGGKGNDPLLDGDGGDDRIYGDTSWTAYVHQQYSFPDSDYLYGDAGNDRLYGGPGAVDGLNGYFGNDTLRGGAGRGYLSGGPGDDTFYGGKDSRLIQVNNFDGGPDRDIIYARDKPGGIPPGYALNVQDTVDCGTSIDYYEIDRWQLPILLYPTFDYVRDNCEIPLNLTP